MKIVPVEVKIFRKLKKKKRTLALAESCTGGLVSHRVTDVPGSSDHFMGGVIAYSNSIKVSVLGVPSRDIKRHGAVSDQVARAMAEGARSALGADCAASVTGIAGPSGGSRKKPVGLAYIAFASQRKTKTRKVMFKGGRRDLKEKFADAVLKMIQESM